VGTAVPSESYSQQEILDFFGVRDPRIRSLFLNSAIERRFLTLPPRRPDGTPALESQGQLIRKHTEQGVAMGARALRAALRPGGFAADDVRYLCCVTTTGFLTPGLSALLIRDLGLDHGTHRLDVVGMGCNAGLNGLTALCDWCAAHPGELGVMVCAEVCSAAYVFDGTMRTAVVNSLFGDGAAAVAMVASDGRPEAGGPAPGPGILKFASRIIPDAISAMRYDWDDTAGKFSFFLDREVPYVVGAHAEEVLDRLLEGTGVRRSEVKNWIIHSGGKKVIDSVQVNLGLTRHDVRHTIDVLREYGNLSSGSFLFSYQRLAAEQTARKGDYTLFMTMGPGSTIEMALAQH
jgi:predicted naringenin-chalcone synthase